MKDIELPPLPRRSLCEFDGAVEIDLYTKEQMQSYARAAVEADRAQRVPDAVSDKLDVLELALKSVQRRISGASPHPPNEPLDCALKTIEKLRSLLASTPAQPAQQEQPQRKLSAVDLAKAAAKEQFRHYREVMVNAHQEPPQPVERKPMTPEQVKDLMESVGYEAATPQEKADFINGIRHAERHHGIKEQT